MKKKYLLIGLLSFFAFQSSVAQLPNGSIAPNFTLVDLNGTSHTLYDYLDAGQTVFIDFSAIWCGPCWTYHTSGALEDLYENHGPSGLPNVSPSTTNDAMVFFIEGDGSSVAQLNGGSGSQGDWVTGTPYPIICTDGNPNSTAVVNDYQIGYWPTVYQVCPDRTLTLCGQTASPYSLITACLPPPSYNNDARSFMNNSAASGCSSISPELSIQNYGLSNLTEVTIDVSLNGVLQYSTNLNQIWSNATNSYQPLNLSTLDIVDIVLDPVTGLVNSDLISIEVSLPNGVVDADPLNNQTISFAVDLGFDNAYWDGGLSITVAGDAQNSWYLKQVSNNLTIASGFGGVTGVTNTLGNLTFNECYTLQSINGANLAYTVTDAMGNTVLDGSASSVEDFDNFTTGDEMWTGINDNNLSAITVYPLPVNNKLYIDGEYENLRILDLLGKEVLESSYVKFIDVSNVNNGIYLLELKSSTKKYYKKIQIAK
jgi:hypothetical protein